MKNYLTYIIALVIAVSLNACSVGYSEADKKVTEKYCSCFKDVAKQSVDIHEWYSEHSEELDELRTKKSKGEDWSSDADFVEEGEEMLEKWHDLKEEAFDVCYEDFIDGEGDYYEAVYMSKEDPEGKKSPLLPDAKLRDEFCPEVSDVQDGVLSIEALINSLVEAD